MNRSHMHTILYDEVVERLAVLNSMGERMKMKRIKVVFESWCVRARIEAGHICRPKAGVEGVHEYEVPNLVPKLASKIG